MIGPARRRPARHARPLVGQGRGRRRRQRLQRHQGRSPPATTFTPGLHARATSSRPATRRDERLPRPPTGFADAVAAAKAADQVVLALGETREMSGEAAVAHRRSTCPGEEQELIDADQGHRQAVRGGALQRPPAHPVDGRRELAGHPRGVVPRRRGRQRGRRRGLRQGQPGRQAAGLVPAAARPGADLLQPRADRSPVRRRPRSTTRATATCAPATRCTPSASA